MNMIFLLLNVILIIFIITTITKNSRNTISLGTVSIKFKKVVVYTFFSLLILSLPILYLLPKEHLIKSIDGDKLQEQMAKEDFMTLYKDGKLDTASTIIKQNSYKFNINDKTFEINQGVNSFVEIISEEKQVADGIIEVDLYSFRSSFNNIEITKIQAMPKITMENNKLIIEKEREPIFKYKKFTSNFISAQFKNGSSSYNEFNLMYRPNILLIRYPKGINYQNKK